jgi:Glycosyl hydrolase family 26
MVTRRSFIGGALAAPVVASTAGVVLRGDTPAGAASPYSPSEERMEHPPFLFGLHAPRDILASRLRTREQQLGRAADVVLVFARITEPVNDIVPALLDAGYEVALCLEWWGPAGGAHDPDYSLKEIASGRHDDNAIRWFRSLRDLPRPVHVRPLHEGNGDWYPWGVFSGGNQIRDYVPAFRHVVRLLWDHADGRGRVQWCVNRMNGRERNEPVSAIYPGDDWVHELAVNGYNRPTYSTSTSFADVIRPNYRALKDISTSKPFWIGETASTEKYGDKARWIREMFETVRREMVVDCLTWFDNRLAPRNEPVRDWNLDSSGAALDAFKRGIAIDRGVGWV